ncbi:MAG: MerR family transcriptional regulator [bacterium]|nr:MerR family transcriptional regulator [bacterium]
MKIPDKLYFKIGEVAKMVGVEPYVLRYWETEFHEIEPIKSRAGQRLYRRKDVGTIMTIQTLLYGEGYTIEGARKKLREINKQPQMKLGLPDQSSGAEKTLKKIRQELEAVVKILG